MQYVRLYVEASTDTIKNVHTQQSPISTSEPVVGFDDAGVQIAYTRYDLQLEDHPDGFKRARYLQDRLEVAAGVPQWQSTVPTAERLTILSAVLVS